MRPLLLAFIPVLLAAAEPAPPAPPAVGQALRAAAPAVAALQERFAPLGEALRLHLAAGGPATGAAACTLSDEEVLGALRRLEPGRHDDAEKALGLVARAQERSARALAAFAKQQAAKIGANALADLLAGGRYVGVSGKIEAENGGAVGYEAELVYVVPCPPDKNGRPQVGRVRIEVNALWDGKRLGLLSISDLDLDKP